MAAKRDTPDRQGLTNKNRAGLALGVLKVAAAGKVSEAEAIRTANGVLRRDRGR